MSMTKVPNKQTIGAIRTSIHFIRNYLDAQALPNTPPPSPLPNLNLLSQTKTLKMNIIADELIDMFSTEKNNNQKLYNEIIQLTKERESLKQQLTDCEQSTQQMVCHYVGLLEKERLETTKWMSLATKQEQLVSTLEKKELSHQLMSKVLGNELEDKQKLLDILVDERQILLKRINSKTPPLLLKPLSSSKQTNKPAHYRQIPLTPITPTSISLPYKSKRSSIEILEHMVATDLLMYPLTPIRRCKTDTISPLPPPPSPPPPMPLPQLPPSPRHHHYNNNGNSKSKKQTFHRSQPPLPKSAAAIKSILNENYKRETMPDKKSLFSTSYSSFAVNNNHKNNKHWKNGHFT